MDYVYILSSLKQTRFYIGVTKNPEIRLQKHNSGSSKSTKPYRPWQIIHLEKYNDKSTAYKREYYLKSPAGFLEKKRITTI